MKITLPTGFQLDGRFFTLGKGRHFDLEGFFASSTFEKSWQALQKLRQKGVLETPQGELSLGFVKLPYLAEESPSLLEEMRRFGQEVRENYKTLLVVGIGGSSLGGQMLVRALSPKAPPIDIRFLGNNLDPYSFWEVLKDLTPEETAVLAISKSGTTVEPLVAFLYLWKEWLKTPRKNQITFVTDPERGFFRKLAREEGWRAFPIPENVGGRWSVLSPVGLLLLEALGVNSEELLEGAKALDKEMETREKGDNPVALYASLVYLAYEQGYTEAVIMPYCDRLYPFALWYVQLLSESLGKGKLRSGLALPQGRTPIPALGTTDMHSQTQQHQEGLRNKVITFLQIEDHGEEVELPCELPKEVSHFSGKKMSQILKAALEANRRALHDDGRPSITLTIPRLSPFHLGEWIYFFELATALEGEFLDVNAYDQEGVEAYKKYLREYLRG